MRVAITSQPGAGHLNTLLGLALALRDAGHEPTLYGAAGLRPEIEAHGLGFAPAGVDWRESDLLTAFPEFLSEQPTGIAMDPALWPHLARPLAHDLEAHFARRAPDVVVAEAFEYGSQLVAERRGLPVAVVDTLVAGPVFAQRQRFGVPLEPARAALSLGPDPTGDVPYRHLRLLPVPERYDGPRPLPPAGERFNLGLPGRPPPVEALPVPAGDAPLVLASLGTVLHPRAGVREAVLDALRDEPVRVVFALGPGADPAAYGPPGPGVLLARRVPQPWLLPRCAVFVTHGGTNSVREALIAGTPLVVVPLGFDQPYHARRCAALGLARVVAPEQRTPAAIRDAVRGVLDDAGMAERARAFAEEMAAMPDARAAVRRLERLAA
ncbi:MAG TPA: glycosyltransferase [Solirubrobacteraceae bacterium]|nr:glycosyltransferase [Solirubrobacteraceae bacterium]